MLLKIHVEGQTEAQFVNDILQPYLSELGYSTLVIINQTSPLQRGGLSHYKQFKKNTQKLCGSHPCLITTMIDFYQLPHDFPGYRDMASKPTATEKVEYLEEELKNDLAIKTPNYFIPYIQLHEFEALLFSDISTIDSVMQRYCGSTLKKLQTIMDTYNEPENINTDESPSKKLETITDNKYKKILHGGKISKGIPLETMREKCPHFNRWLCQLEEFSKEHC